MLLDHNAVRPVLNNNYIVDNVACVHWLAFNFCDRYAKIPKYGENALVHNLTEKNGTSNSS